MKSKLLCLLLCVIAAQLIKPFPFASFVGRFLFSKFYEMKMLDQRKHSSVLHEISV
jgi:hypothetical protein